MKSIQDYLELPYTVTIRRDEDGDYVAVVRELPGCVTHAATAADALTRLTEVQYTWLDQRLQAGLDIPIPVEEVLPSGKWLQRAPRSLHQRLIELAKDDGVSFNQLVTGMLS